jgi:hypothetical protein
MVTTPEHRLPREYVGQARLLLNWVRQEGLQYKAAVDRIWYPLKARHKAHGKVRHELLVGALLAWQRDVPAFGRLGDVHHELRGYSLNVGEFRLLSGELRFDHWTDNAKEGSLAVELVSMSINRKACHLRSETLIVLSLHALARRYERCLQRDLDDVFADIKMIVRRHEALLTQTYFTLPCQEGHWRGEVVRADFEGKAPAKRVLAIRTYIGESMMQAA